MLLNVITAVSMGLILLGPIVLVIWAGKRSDWRARWVIAGAVTFIGSQVVHLPLNWGLSQAGLLVTSTPIDLTAALTLGLTAGLCEELARAATLTWWVSEVRDHNKATALGLGHGGIEAVFIGILGTLSLINILALQSMDLNTLDLEPEHLEQVKAQVAAFSSQPAWQPAASLIERAMAMVNHLFMTMLVLTSIVQRQWRWLAAAIAWHTVVNAVAVWLHQHYGVLAAEGALALLTVAAGYGWWMTRSGLLSDKPS